MNRTYAYKGFEVTVGLEPSGNEGVWLRRPHGFVSVVRIRSDGAIGDAFKPISLMADGQRPFATEAEAFTAGYSAALRLIDDGVVL
ncbi:MULTISPECIES: hypothetical protein [Paraburkholderia]|uniref:hypothetical protein n=1 Tax=Paraburkholderia TaxID=1822464 RepID=UPI0003700571|nr:MULTISPECIES: hypothetical protein [Paraburkholderia]MDH6147091.1 hypothetical protein [Paraburkholderia sp. WSM4179]